MKSFLKKNWRWLCGLYAFIYLPWFFYLEKTITLDTPGIHIISSPIDAYIPFIEAFIIPYILWFIYMGVAIVYMFFKGTDAEFGKFALSLIIGMTTAMLICMIYPNGLNFRPNEVSNSIFGRIIQVLHSTDTSTNVFPSIHVYNSLAVHIALSKCNALSKHKYIKLGSLILCILICISTVCLKQHSFVDVVGACIMMTILYLLIYVIDYSGLFKRSKEKDVELHSNTL